MKIEVNNLWFKFEFEAMFDYFCWGKCFAHKARKFGKKFKFAFDF